VIKRKLLVAGGKILVRYDSLPYAKTLRDNIVIVKTLGIIDDDEDSTASCERQGYGNAYSQDGQVL